ncbi:MAG: hypothetical protein JXA97_06925 [Anaerolineales bacterium]|nr:hypothetical protein [Anaerolineales bacterium]
MQSEEVAQAKSRYETFLFTKPNVVGVGSGYRTVGARRTDELCVIAMVDQKVPRAALTAPMLIPEEVGGIPTDVVQVGRLSAHSLRLTKVRPSPGGVSVGHYLVTAGTLGCVVRDRMTNKRMLLSNNHVFANSNQSAIGDPILQPGAVDGGAVPEDVIARLERAIPLRFSTGPATCPWAQLYAGLGNRIAGMLGAHHSVEVGWRDLSAENEVDAALAAPLEDSAVSDEILDIGVIGGTTPPALGMLVRKSGRSSGFTTGTITILDASVDIHYGDRSARFVHQVVTIAMSTPGDSGSILVDGGSLLAVGLLFAGSDQATIYNPIQTVLLRLEVVL